MSELPFRPGGLTVLAIREILQKIQSREDLSREAIAGDVKKLNALVSRLEVELTCPLTECPLHVEKKKP